MEESLKKLRTLKENLASLGSAVVAYSGGVDSAFLLKMALESLGSENSLAVTAVSETYPKKELETAEKLACEIGARLVKIKTEELSRPEFYLNPPERCYSCKFELFSRLEALRQKENLNFVIDGSNADDLSDYRPGAKAALDFNVRSPLQEAGLTKEDIRALSKKAGLPTWDKPALACLASRIPYGERITSEKLKSIDSAESFLRESGIKNIRVRHHGSLARIETDKSSMALFLNPEFREKTVQNLKAAGFKYITLDIEGYRTGSMNEELEAT